MVNGLNPGLTKLISRNLAVASKRVGQSLQRLSSGKRINSVFDGTTADTSRITNLEAQSRGLRQALFNVNDTQNIVDTADNALNTMLTVAYNIRELAQKASDTSLTSDERDLIVEEASGLIEDLTNLAANTTYTNASGINTFLLDNSFGTKTIQAGANARDRLSFSIGDARTSTLGQLAIYSGAQNAITNPIGGNLTFNGVTVESTVSDGYSTTQDTNSALAIVNAINESAGDTGVYAETVGTIQTLATAFSSAATFAGVLSAGDFLLNGVSITGTMTSATAFASAVNGVTADTGIVATVSGTDVTLTAQDGRNIAITMLSGGVTATFDNVHDVFNLSANAAVFSTYATLSTGASKAFVGAVRIWSSSAITVGGTNPSLAIGIASGTQAIVSGTDVASIDLSTATLSDQANKILDATIAQISTLRAEIGTIHDRIDHAASFLVGAYDASETAKEAIQSVDFVSETLSLVVAQLLQDSSISALTQANISQDKVSKLLENL